MARSYFDQLIDSKGGVATKRRRLLLPFSIGLHAVALLAVILAPLYMWEEMPEPVDGAVHAFFVEAAPPPPPPPPPPPAAPKPVKVEPKVKQPEPEKPKPVIKDVPKFTAPVEVPKEVPKAETADTGATEGVGAGEPGGMDGGVEGGEVGGVVGGEVGGTVGGTVGGELGGQIGGQVGGTGTEPVPEPVATPEPAPKVPDGPVRVGGQVRAPRKLKDVAPRYTEIARQARVSGVVIIEATIGTDGRVDNVKVLRGIPLLNDSAVEAVKQWVYSPTMLNGQAVAVIMTVTVNFKLAD